MTKAEARLIAKLAKAGLEKRKVAVEYLYLDHKKGTRAAILEPLHFIRGVRGGCDKLHVVAYDHEAGGIRQFAVSNILSAKLVRKGRRVG